MFFFADLVRKEKHPDNIVTWIIDRNVNITNVCLSMCTFCNFCKPRHHCEAYITTPGQYKKKIDEMTALGGDQLLLQGGMHPDLGLDFYTNLFKELKDYYPSLKLHALGPPEIVHLGKKESLSYGEVLRELVAAGLNSLPGAGAEILSDRVRKELSPKKATTQEWLDVMREAHRMGMVTSATMMFGHVDSPASWARHLAVVGHIQEETGGFTEFVPLPFVHMEAPIYRQGRARPGPTWDEVVLVHAVARLAFDGLIPNLQASWVKLGLEGAAALLRAGVNDLGGTLMDEGISRAAGAAHGAGVTPGAMEEAIRAAGRVPAERTTLYELRTGAPASRRPG